MEGAVAIVIVVGIAALALVVKRGGLDGARFSVRVTGEGVQGVRVRGQVPGYGADEVAAFVGALGLPTGAEIRGIPQGGRVVLRLSSQVPEPLHQRLRNFFYVKQ